MCRLTCVRFTLLEPELQSEYDRFLAQLDHSTEVGPPHVSAQDVLRAHFLIANQFYLEGQGLGGVGPKDLNLLQSAVSRQFVEFGGRAKWTNHFDIAATLFFGLIKNHPFHDANKRTAFLTALYQLDQNGWCPSVDERHFEELTVNVAESSLKKYARFQKNLKDRSPDPDVEYISWFFRNNTRAIDKKNIQLHFENSKPSLIDMDIPWRIHKGII